MTYGLVAAPTELSHLDDLLATVDQSSLKGDVALLLVVQPEMTATAQQFRRAHPELTVVVDERSFRLRSGEIHKLAIERAVMHRWEALVFVLAGAAPSKRALAGLVSPLAAGSADAVIGARRQAHGARGRTSDALLSSISRAHLTDWHSPFRAYRFASLRDLDVAADSDGDEFDVQLLLRLRAAGRRVVEVPIDAARNGAPISPRTNLRGLADVSRAELGRRGFGRGDLGRTAEVYQFKPSEHSSHSEILGLVPATSPLRILDVGCGAGFLADNLRRNGHRVVGIDIFDAPDVRSRVDEFHQCDLDHGLVDDVGDEFDLIIAADVVEHVREPDLLLTSLRTRLAPGGSLIVSVPNFGHWYPRGRTALGLFDYDQRGILDTGHVRLFTLRSFRRLAAQTGFEVTSERSTGLPLDALRIRTDRGFGRAVARIDALSTVARKTLFSYQFVFTMVPSVEPAVTPSGDREP